MKTIALFLTLLATSISCVAMPPAHVPPQTWGISWVAPQADSVNIYAANFADMNWTLVRTVPANVTNITVIVPYQLFTAQSTNNNGTFSDYSPIATNAVPLMITNIVVKQN